MNATGGPLAEDHTVIVLPQGQLPGRYFKDRAHTQSSESCDLNLWLCLMGPASFHSVLGLFIWGKDIPCLSCLRGFLLSVACEVFRRP